MIGLALVIIVTNVGLLKVMSSNGFRNEDVSSYEARFGNLREHLSGVDKVGYMSDCQGNQNDAAARLFIAQYAVAPVIVVDSIESELVIGNFCHSKIDKALWTEKKLLLIKDFGEGVMLFRRAVR